MAIAFFNIKNKEVRIAESEPLIAAMYNSGDRGPNAREGQDFGWRLAPEVVVQMRRIMNDPLIIERIAARTNRGFEDIGEKEILKYISDMTSPEDAPVAQLGDYEDDYLAEIQRLTRKEKTASKKHIKENNDILEPIEE